jgi:hypothetical protein
MRHRHRDGSSGRRGHGRQRVELAIRPVSRAVDKLLHRVQWRVVAKVIEYCIRENCGAVEWSDPSMRQRARSWFASRKLPWDWTGFASRLTHKLWVNGIEIRKRSGGEPKPEDRSQVANGSSRKGSMEDTGVNVGETVVEGDGSRGRGTKRRHAKGKRNRGAQ